MLEQLWKGTGMCRALVGPVLFLPEQEGCMRAPYKWALDTTQHDQSFAQGMLASQKEFLFLPLAALPCAFCATLHGA